MVTHIFFDFDGVLCESVAVKTEAFRQLYAPYGKDIADAVVTYHQANGGVSRYHKIRHYHKTFLHKELTDAQMQQWAARFAKLAIAGVVAAPEVPGTIQFLEDNRHLYTYWVVTATPTAEIKQILAQKGWDKYFAGVYGSPENKGHWAAHILQTHNLHPSQVVFVGDALADQKAATENGIKFILRHTTENKMLFPYYTGYAVNDLTELKNVISTL